MSALNGVTSAIVGAANVASGGSSYQVDRSLRFNSNDTANLYKSFSSSTSSTKSTLSFWVKRGKVGFRNTLFSGYGSIGGSYTFCNIEFQANDTISCGNNVGQTFETTQVFRDPSAWYHFVLAFDTTQASSSDRIKFYVNGSQVTAFNTASYPGQDGSALIFGDTHNFIAANQSAGSPQIPGDIYVAEMHFVDGQGLAPTEFGEYDSDNNWNPKDCKDNLTYGTNGFYLNFSDNSSASALGTDTSGNGNNWTVNNISVTAGEDNDSLIDTPTNYTAASGNNGGNYATLNPLQKGSSITLSNGNLDVSHSGSNNAISVSTIGVSSGKWYVEFTLTTSNANVGITNNPILSNGYLGQGSGDYVYYNNGKKYNNATGATYGDSFGAGDTIGVAFDADGGNIYFYKNGIVQNSGTAAYTGLTSGPYFFGGGESAGSGQAGNWNFGQRQFAISSIPTGYKSLCTTNFPDPTIADGLTAFDVALWTGNGSSQTVSSLNFNPDIIWTKTRSHAVDSKLVDTVRGISEVQETNQARADYTDTNGVTSTSATGFSLGSGGDFNTNGRTYVGWTWDCGTSTASNTDGSITTNVRVNTSAGCSIVTYTGTGSNATFGHGLGATPEFVIVKSRSNTQNWAVYHASNSVGGATPAELYAYLNSGNAVSSTDAGPFWNNTAPTSSVVNVGTDNDTNASSYTYVAYCFAPVDGFSNFGVFTGNGSTNGPFVYTGFRPNWVMVKSETYAGNWNIFDYRRPEYNETDGILRANTSGAEFDGSAQGSFSIGVDLLSNGFKIRQAGVDANSSGQRLIYAAFAEHPFKTSRAR